MSAVLVPADEAVASVVTQDWPRIEEALQAEGHAVLRGLLSRDQSQALAALYDQAARFRSRVVMARHGFGQGEYQYFAYPLPEPVAALRHTLYPRLALRRASPAGQRHARPRPRQPAARREPRAQRPAPHPGRDLP